MAIDSTEIEVQKVKIRDDATAIVSRASALIVNDAASYAVGGEYLVGVKTCLKRVGDVFDDIIDSAHKHHKLMVAEKKKHAEPFEHAERIIKSKMSAFQMEQERIRLEEERRLREEARKLEEERRLAEAVELEKLGQKEEAEQIIDAPIHVPVIFAPMPVAKADGVSTKKIRKARVINASMVPREYMIVDEQKIAQFARMHGENAAMPGVEFYWETIVSARSR